MTALEFLVDWEPIDESVQAPELRTTWARLELWVAGRCATLVEDVPVGSTRRSISVPLYPIAEWVAYNWWLLRFNGRRSTVSNSLDRRNLRSAGDGFIWPDLEIVPAGEVASVRWDALTTDSLRYFSNGRSWLDALSLQRSLGELVQTVILRLREFGINNTPLQQEWLRIEALDREEADFCEAAARLGLDPFSEALDRGEEIAQAFENLEPALRTDFFDAVQPDSIHDALAWISQSLSEAFRPDDFVTPKFGLELVSSVLFGSARMNGAAPPWLAGYEVARLLRQELKLLTTEPLPQNIPVRTGVLFSDIEGLSGIGATPEGSEWTRLVVRVNAPSARRFAAARAMWHAVTTTERGRYLLTNASSTNQQIGRAFAAEALAPAEGIRQLLGTNAAQADEADLALVAEHFQASDWVIVHQIQNQLQYG